MTVPAYNCICDTNIWVNVCLGDIHETYIRKFSTIGVVDVVKNEILKWQRNSGRFQKIATFFLEYENKGLAILDAENIDPVTNKIIAQELSRWGFSDVDNSSKTIEDLGEFVSLLYAYHLEVPFIHTADGNFGETIKMNDLYNQYKGIEIITWNQVSSDLTENDSERLVLNQKVIQENEVMGNQRKKAMEDQVMNRKLIALRNRLSTR